MSFSALRDIFIGRIGADYCVRSVLSLRSPNNVKEYLIGIHRVAFPDGDTIKNERWRAYTRALCTNATPIRERNLSDPKFMSKQACI